MEQLANQHSVYTGMHFKGAKGVPFGKCRCGAYLDGKDEIDRHREEFCGMSREGEQYV